jgi:hypothetical protein
VLIKAQEDLARDRPELGLTTHIKKVGKGRGGEALDARFDMTPGAHFANCSEEPNAKYEDDASIKKVNQLVRKGAPIVTSYGCNGGTGYAMAQPTYKLGVTAAG